MLSRVSDAREIVQERYSVATIDLDGDGQKEIVLRADSSAFCGSGGCAVLVLREEDKPAAAAQARALEPPGLGLRGSLA